MSCIRRVVHEGQNPRPLQEKPPRAARRRRRRNARARSRAPGSRSAGTARTPLARSRAIHGRSGCALPLRAGTLRGAHARLSRGRPALVPGGDIRNRPLGRDVCGIRVRGLDLLRRTRHALTPLHIACRISDLSGEHPGTRCSTRFEILRNSFRSISERGDALAATRSSRRSEQSGFLFRIGAAAGPTCNLMRNPN